MAQQNSLFGSNKPASGPLFSANPSTGGSSSSLFSGSTIFGNQQAGGQQGGPAASNLARAPSVQAGGAPGGLFGPSTGGNNQPGGQPSGQPAQTNASSGLFGGALNKTQSGSQPSSLFGGSQPSGGQGQPGNPPSSLFGKPNQPAGPAATTGNPPSSLFGGSQPSGGQGQPGNPPSSLFGAKTTPPAGPAATTGNPPSSLFGGSQPSGGQGQPGNASSSLFGKPATQQPQGGTNAPANATAGGQTQPSSGLFASTGNAPGGQGQQQPQGQAGGLFGGNAAASGEQKPASGLFGNAQGQPQQTAGQSANKPSSLFGNQPTSGAPAAGGQTAAGQTAAPTAAPTSGGGLFGNAPTGGQSASAPAAGGLFSSNKTTTPGTGPTTSTSLFSSSGTAPAAPGGATTTATATSATTTSTTAPATGGLFGGNQPKPGDAAAKPADVDQSMRMNMTVEELMRSWKKDLDSQVQNFQGLTKFLTQHELDCYKNIEMGQKLAETLEEMDKEYRAIEFSLGGIDKGQDNLYQKLDIIEQELSNYLYPEQSRPMPESSMSRIDLVNMARKMNSDIFQIEEEMLNLVQEMNQPVDEKDPTQLTENVLNNYFDALQFIETETLKSMNKLSKIESLLSNQ